MEKKRIIATVITIILILLIFLFLVRLVSEKQLDDVSPEIPCEKKLLAKADIFYIIPKFNNKSIADDKIFCQEILALNKTLALHGVYHTYYEFSEDKDEAYLQEGINIFKECFNLTPTRFKPPQLKISKNNKLLIKKMKLDLNFNQLTHKVYHCNDADNLPNWLIDLV